MSVVSLAEVKDFLDITNNVSDDELQAMLDRAEAVIARRVGPLGPTVIINEVHSGPGPLLLRRFPVVSVTSADVAGVSTEFDADTDAGVVHGFFGFSPRSVKVSYVAGRTELPEDLAAAVLELVKHLWESQRGNSPAAMALQGSEVDLPSSGGGYLLPYRVQSLIEPHLLPASIA